MRDKRRSQLSMLGALVVLAVIAALLFRRVESPPTPAPVASGSPSPSRDADVESSALIAEPVGVTQREDAPLSVEANPSAAIEQVPYVVRGSIVGVPLESLSGARVLAIYKNGRRYGEADHGIAVVHADGTYEIDVTPLVVSGPMAQYFGKGLLELSLAHPRLTATEVEFTAAQAVDETIGAKRAHVIHTTIRANALTTVRGEVVHEDGKPAVGAEIRLVWPRSSASRFQMVGRAKCDADGRFTLNCAAGGEFELVVMLDQFQPLSAPITVPSREVTDAGRFVITDGAAISGVLVTPSGRSPEQFTVRAARITEPGDIHQYYPDAGELLWRPNYLGLYSTTCVPDRDGNFKLSGLHPGEHRLFVHPIGMSGGVTLGTLSFGQRQYTAPCDSIVLTYDVAQITLLVTEHAAPIEGAKVTLSTQREAQPLTDYTGRCSWWVHPNELYAFEIEHPDFFNATLECRAPAAGMIDEHVIALTRKSAGSLLLRIQGENEEAIQEVGVWLREAVSGTEEDDDEGRELYFESDARDGVYLFEKIGTGDYHVRVEPCGVFTHRVCHYAPAAFDATIKHETQTTKTLVLAHAGQLRISVRDPDGHVIAANVGVFDDHGKFQKVRFYGEAGQTPESDVFTAPETPSITLPGLPAGTYELRPASERFSINTVQCTVVAERTTDVILEAIPK